VEQRQYELLELLLATPWSQDDSGGTGGSSGGGSSATGSTSGSGGGDCALLVFLRFLLQKNMYALRDVAPPGLSEPTVLMSTFFGLLRLLQPALQAACSGSAGSGPLAAFPAAQLFTRVGPAAEAEPVFNMPRLGGVVTHLAREHPITDAEQQPVWLGQGQQQQRGSSASGSRNVHLQVSVGGRSMCCMCRLNRTPAVTHTSHITRHSLTHMSHITTMHPPLRAPAGRVGA
jgi:hypothetical protein